MSEPDADADAEAVAVAVDAVRAMDDDASDGAALDVLVRAAAQLTGGRAVALLPLEGRWHSGTDSAGGDAVPVGVSPACDTVRRDGVGGLCDDHADGVVRAFGPVHLLPVPSLDAVAAVVALTRSAGPTERGLLELLCRHAGLHVARLDDARLRDDLLDERAAALGT
ncbi:MAG: hypothetical protein ACLGIG_00975, partial [Actinomycetes bacterium]